MAKKRGVPAHGRKSARFHRARKKRYLVVAGGAVTERQYFKQLESIYDVVIEYQQKNESPEHLADFACTLKKEDERDISTDCYENIWVVVDVDDFHDHSKAAKNLQGQWNRTHHFQSLLRSLGTRSYEGLSTKLYIDARC